ncbi:MAG TPA: hypothetical protein VG099_23785 [Gemmataceae bacterium]|jgi:hypothetical protein|nr:hypothetical protein [Gemmataceae bacterium]
MSASNAHACGEPILGVPADDFCEFVDRAVTNGAKLGDLSSGARPQLILSVEVSDFEEFSAQAVTSPAELRLLARPKPNASATE